MLRVAQDGVQNHVHFVNRQLRSFYKRGLEEPPKRRPKTPPGGLKKISRKKHTAFLYNLSATFFARYGMFGTHVAYRFHVKFHKIPRFRAMFHVKHGFGGCFMRGPAPHKCVFIFLRRNHLIRSALQRHDQINLRQRADGHSAPKPSNTIFRLATARRVCAFMPLLRFVRFFQRRGASGASGGRLFPSGGNRASSAERRPARPCVQPNGAC